MKSFTQLAVVAALAAFATAQSSTASSSAAAAPTEVTDCHLHGDTPFCFAGEDEWEVETDVNNDDLPDAYMDCHSHGADELHCESPSEVTLVSAAAEDEEDHAEEDHDHDHEHSSSSSSSNATSTDEITSLTGCHAHDDTLFCFAGEDEWEVVSDDVDVANAPEEYSDCHAHGAEELHCSSPSEVTLAATTDHSEEHAEGDSAAEDHTHSTTESGETTTESQTAGNGASAMEISRAVVVGGVAVAALWAF